VRPYPALLLLLAGCGGTDADPVVVPTRLDPATLGAIRGVVRFAGTPPANPRLPLGGNPECVAHHPGGATADVVLVRDGRLQNVLVSVKRGLEGRVFAWPKDPVRIANARCVYVPRVAGVMTHQPLEFTNEDATDHNVHGFPEQGGFNFTLHGQGTARTIKARRPEAPFRVKCDLHPWMLGWVGVFDHPYFRVTGPDGTFELPGLPGGCYELEAWHESLGTLTATVTVDAGKTAEASFEFRP
jgi:hypothetical protein